jgi:hypothetical protein
MRATNYPEPVLTPYTEAQICFARSAWPMRAAQEFRSARIYRALVGAARIVGIAPPWPTRFALAMRDELRHARLCAAVGARLGAEKPEYDARPVRARLEGLSDLRTRVAALLLVEVAIGETISMYLFRAGHRLAIEPLTRAALGSILHDEVRHQSLGWKALVALESVLTQPEWTAMQREAAHGLAACEQQTAVPAMRWLERRQPFDPAHGALGVLNPEVRVEAFYRAVETFVVPRLTRMGLDGALAWSNRYRS